MLEANKYQHDGRLSAEVPELPNEIWFRIADSAPWAWRLVALSVPSVYRSNNYKAELAELRKKRYRCDRIRRTLWETRYTERLHRRFRDGLPHSSTTKKPFVDFKNSRIVGHTVETREYIIHADNGVLSDIGDQPAIYIRTPRIECICHAGGRVGYKVNEPSILITTKDAQLQAHVLHGRFKGALLKVGSRPWIRIFLADKDRNRKIPGAFVGDQYVPNRDPSQSFYLSFIGAHVVQGFDLIAAAEKDGVYYSLKSLLARFDTLMRNCLAYYDDSVIPDIEWADSSEDSMDDQVGPARPLNDRSADDDSTTGDGSDSDEEF